MLPHSGGQRLCIRPWHQTPSNMHSPLGANRGRTPYYAQPEARLNPCNDTA